MDTKKQAVQSKKEDEEEKEEKPATKKPRIRLRVKAKPDEDAKVDTGKNKKKGLKRARSPEPEAEPEGENATANDDIDLAPIPKKQKKEKKQKPDKKPAPASGKEVADAIAPKAQPKEQSRKKSSRGQSNGGAALESKGGAAFADLAAWKTKKSLLGESFKESRAFLTSEGPWQLPDNVPADKFADVAKATLKAMGKIDKYSVFARAVTDNEAPGYSETILHPMDFGTMLQKVDSGTYGTGSTAAKAFYEDFLLVFDNCILYNEEGGEVAVEAARVLRQLPEAFVGSVLAVNKTSK
jgi:Bromodomain